jgi:hypothetical protein
MGAAANVSQEHADPICRARSEARDNKHISLEVCTLLLMWTVWMSLTSSIWDCNLLFKKVHKITTDIVTLGLLLNTGA